MGKNKIDKHKKLGKKHKGHYQHLEKQEFRIYFC